MLSVIKKKRHLQLTEWIKAIQLKTIGASLSNKTKKWLLLSMETKENLSKCQQKSQELFVWKSKKSFLEKYDTTAKYNISLDPVVEHAPSRYPIKSPPDYTCHDYRRHYCHFCSDANQIWMAFLSKRRREVTDVSGRNFGGETFFWVDFRGMVPLKDESRLRDGDDPVRAERGEMKESGDKVEWGLK